MKARTVRIAGLMVVVGIGIVWASAAWAQAPQPRVSNARMEARSASAGLDQAFRAIVRAQPAAAWAGYSVPIIAGRHDMCCYSSTDDANRGCCAGCSLEG